MKIEKINTPAAGTWARDCELISLSAGKGLKIIYHKDEDDTYWCVNCKNVVVCKLLNEEFSTAGYLTNLPIEGAFYEIKDSPWIDEFPPVFEYIFANSQHYILRFYDEAIEIIARELSFERLPDRPGGI